MYADLATMRQYLKIDAAKTADDALLTRLLAAATAAINSHTGRVFASPAATVRRFDTDAIDQRTLWLDCDLAELVSVTIDGVAADVTAITPQPRNDTPYYALRRAEGWGSDVVITGHWTWSIAPPADIVQACARLAGYWYRLKDAQVFDVTADLQSGQMIVPKGIPSDVKLMLDPYVRLL